MLKKITTLLLFSFYFSAIGQSIDGRVLEEISSGKRKSIIGANVYWENIIIGTVTDKNGYSIQEAPSMPANLLVSFIGYKVANTEIKDDKYLFYLTPNLELDQVNVKEKKKSSNISIISKLNRNINK